ncbi:hypothetical protein CRE_16444 [Caenorhabditis remanei]|uniref:Uncharacterized protein n=1 Tax=Caenorhabditis remanei TaxID=31234 RepID=E3NF86_CAERE|nr:hypothetical protein CRE_16444 [Caenorhabditis remanei]
MISISMIVMLVSYLVETLVCLSIGTIYEDAQCAELPLKTVLLCIHRYAEAFSLAAQMFFTIERVMSIQFEHIHRSIFFKIFFIAGFLFSNFTGLAYVYTSAIKGEYGTFWLIAFQLFVIANFPFVLYAKKISTAKYKADVRTYSLKRKHNLYNSYEIARSFLYAAAIYMISQLACFGLLWAFQFGLLFDGNRAYFPRLFFVISLIWHANLTTFPWIVMLIHRSQRERIYKVWMQMFPETKSPAKILGMNGKELVATPTQNDYFDQLQQSWK